MLDRLTETIALMNELVKTKGIAIALSAFAGGLARMIRKASSQGSAVSFRQVLGGLFLAACVGVIAGNLAWRYLTQEFEIVTAVGFVAAYVSKRIFDWLDAADLKDLIRYLRGVKK